MKTMTRFVSVVKNPTSLAVLFVLLADLLSKAVALANLASPFRIAIFRFELVKNFGAVLATGRQLPIGAMALLSLTTASIFLIMSIGVQFYLPNRIRTLQLGLGLLSGGFLANAIDRVSRGFVTDFLSVELGSANLPFLNLADLFQWVGYVLVLHGTITIWRALAKEPRSPLPIVNRRFQVRYCVYLQLAMTSGFAPMFLGGLVIFGPTNHSWNLLSDHFLSANPLLLLYILIAIMTYLALSIFCWLLGIKLSHRTAGAISKFQILTRKMLSENDLAIPLRRLSLRDDDDFIEELEALSNHIADYCEAARRKP